jgi:hypothetical protein
VILHISEGLYIYLAISSVGIQDMFAHHTSKLIMQSLQVRLAFRSPVMRACGVPMTGLLAKERRMLSIEILNAMYRHPVHRAPYIYTNAPTRMHSAAFVFAAPNFAFPAKVRAWFVAPAYALRRLPKPHFYKRQPRSALCTLFAAASFEPKP